MFGRLMPKEGNFFELFNAHADRTLEGAQELVQLMKDFSNSAEHARRIDEIEKSADRITHDTLTLLHQTFITPLDRDQIHKLISTQDDILDLIQDVAESIHLYDIQQVTPECAQLADICLRCCERVKTLVGLLPGMDLIAISKTCEEIDRLEGDADRVMRNAMSRLFRDEPDVRTLIKLKAIYELLETVTDRCEDVANVVESIVVENS
jgi:uncharacterized protein